MHGRSKLLIDCCPESVELIFQCPHFDTRSCERLFPPTLRSHTLVTSLFHWCLPFLRNCYNVLTRPDKSHASRVTLTLTHFRRVSRSHSAQWKSHAFSCSTKKIFLMSQVFSFCGEKWEFSLQCYPFSIRGVGNTDIVYVRASDW